MTQESSKVVQAPKTMYDKIWDKHLVYQEPGDDSAILYIDQLLCHEVTSPQAFEGLRMAGRTVRHPDRVMAVRITMFRRKTETNRSPIQLHERK